MNSLVCIGGPHHLWGQGGRGKVGASWSWLPSLPAHSPHFQLTPSSLQPPSLFPSLQLTPSSLQPPSSLPALSSLPSHSQLASACSTLLPSLPSPCSCHSLHSHLTEPHSQCPMNSLVCIWVPTTSGGKGLGGKVGASGSWLPSLTDHSPHSQIPAVTPLTPS